MEEIFSIAVRKRLRCNVRHTWSARAKRIEVSREVEGLLNPTKKPAAFEQPLFVRRRQSICLSRRTPRRTSAVQTLEEIGEGAWAWCTSRQREPDQREVAALKIIKPGMDTGK